MMRLKITWKYCLAFYCVIMLYASLHELVHHFAGFAICGEWGYKTFNSFETACEGTRQSYLATYAGPLFTYVMMYVGMYLLRTGNSTYQKQLGFAMIFAQLPFQRMTGPLFHMNDEYFATVKLYGASDLNFWLVTILVFAICIPPLVQAYRSIENRRPWLWFAFYYFLFPYLLWGPFFGGLEYLMVNKGVLDQTIIGIGLLFVINEVLTILLYGFTRKYIDPFYPEKVLT
ncbi:MAG: hypothetical protein KDD04_09965 [Sinomicrobium sp.]|nr:hypothetical protein [Sinomicrobium sp.]